jgi:hypothetical protein
MIHNFKKTITACETLLLNLAIALPKSQNDLAIW